MGSFSSDLTKDMLKNDKKLVRSIENFERLDLAGIDENMNMPIVWEPYLLKEFNGVEVADIACADDHSSVNVAFVLIKAKNKTTFAYLEFAYLEFSISVLSGRANVLGKQSQEKCMVFGIVHIIRPLAFFCNLHG